jgi:pyrimidine-nucleoside phosphorylase
VNPTDWIERKRDGLAHSEAEIRGLVQAATKGEMADYQIAAWLMAAYLQGLNSEETLALTLAMRDSGERLDLRSIEGIKVDKHSTGGVGDKVSLVVLPIVAAGGVPVVKMSGRGLGFSGGTIDKLEAIPGFRTDLSVEEALAQTKRIGLAILSQTPRLAPADGIFYALRDVTATVPSIPLIAASILSKKLAVGADALLLDVKAGGGSFMKTLAMADELAGTLVRVARGAGIQTEAFVTDMSEPLGRAVGNALEIAEAIRLLRGEPSDERLRELCLILAGRALELGGRAERGKGRVRAQSLLESGAGGRKLEELIEAQGGDPRVVADPSLLPQASHRAALLAESGGYVASIDAAEVGRIAVLLGAGRQKKGDRIDPSTGIELRAKTADPVSKGDALAVIHARSRKEAEDLLDALRRSVVIDETMSASVPLIHRVVA